MATRNLVINDPVGIHARPAAMFAQAVTASGQHFSWREWLDGWFCRPSPLPARP